VEEHSGPGVIEGSERDTPAEDARRYTSPYLDALFAPRADPPNGIAVEDIVALQLPHWCLVCLTGGTCAIGLAEERLEGARRRVQLADNRIEAWRAIVAQHESYHALTAGEKRRRKEGHIKILAPLLTIVEQDPTVWLANLSEANGAVRGPKEISRREARRLLLELADLTDANGYSLTSYNLSQYTTRSPRTIDNWLNRAGWRIEELRIQLQRYRKQQSTRKSN
jgi:hypothetical protein